MKGPRSYLPKTDGSCGSDGKVVNSSKEGDRCGYVRDRSMFYHSLTGCPDELMERILKLLELGLVTSIIRLVSRRGTRYLTPKIELLDASVILWHQSCPIYVHKSSGHRSGRLTLTPVTNGKVPWIFAR